MRDEPPPDGMMAGVTPGAKPSDDEKKKMLPVTTLRPLREGAAELERVPVRELTSCRTATHVRPSPAATRSAASATASACWRLPAWSASRCQAAGLDAARQAGRARSAQGSHHPARAKRVIFLFMNGGLSQVDSFDPKPMLDKYHGQPLPGGTVATERKTGALMKSPFTFKKYGKSGLEVSELFPHVGACADDICVIRSMYTDIPNHEPSMLMMNTGHIQVGRPSMGSWLTYGLGTENKNLPGYVVLCPDVPTTVGPPLWNNAFLPAVHQGTFIPSKVERPDQIVGKDFDPKKLVSFIHNKTFTLRRAAARARSAGHARRDAARRRAGRSAARSRDQLDGNRLPDADRGAGRVRHPQGERGDARSCTARAARRAAA